MVTHSFSCHGPHTATAIRAPGRSAERRLRNAAAGSSKNMTPKSRIEEIELLAETMRLRVREQVARAVAGLRARGLDERLADVDAERVPGAPRELESGAALTAADVERTLAPARVERVHGGISPRHERARHRRAQPLPARGVDLVPKPDLLVVGHAPSGVYIPQRVAEPLRGGRESLLQ